MRQSLWIFAYDIVSDKRRKQVSETLESVGGTRVNQSVFEVWASKADADRHYDAVAELAAKTDRVIRYRVCKRCLRFAVGREKTSTGARVIF
jgi:CRISPR-associated endonuclease Cas2